MKEGFRVTLSYRMRVRIIVTFLLLAFAGPLRAATLTFNGNNTHQVIDGIGVNVNYRGWEGTNLQLVLNAFIDQAGMTLFRVVFDLSDWEAVNDNANPGVMNWSYYNSIYGNTEFTRLWNTMGYLNSRGITNGAFFCFMGWGPAWMMNPNVTASGVRTSLQPGLEAEWAEMIASSAIYARNTRGLKFNLITPNNEPDINFEGIRVDTATQYTNALRKLADVLNANHVTDLGFVAPDRSNGPLGYDFMPEIMGDPVLMARVRHFGTHSYAEGGGSTPTAYNFINNSAYADRSLWVTEFNRWCDCGEGTLGTYGWSYTRGAAENLIQHLANGASAAIVWEGYDSIYAHHFNTWSYWGLFGVDNINATKKTYTARKHFYTVAQVSKWVRPGAQRIGISGSASPFSPMAAFKHDGLRRVTIVGVNTSGGSARLTGTLANMPDAAEIELTYTTASANLVSGGRTAVSNGSFSVTIPADCVFTLNSMPAVDKLAPTLVVESPVEGQLIGGTFATISGTATDDDQGNNGIASVTVGGIRATNDTANGNDIAHWSRRVNLVSGTNRIIIIVRDTQTNAVTNVLSVISDPLRPTLAVGFPRLGARVVTNTASISVTGTAADNRGVTTVRYQLNGGVWLTASGTSNWSAPVVMTAGTNMVRIYSEDAAGLRSLTNGIWFQFVVPRPLTLEIKGSGRVIGATNGQSLEVGRSYTIAAQPGLGFVLAHWSDCGNNVITNRPTFSFLMSSNHCLRAVFEDVQRPVVAIAYPLANSRVLTNNGLVALRGAARDNAGVTAVRYQLNGGPWTLATGTNSWTATALMGLGTNVLAVFAEDAAGLRSLTNRIMFHHVITSPLTLSIVGRGAVSGATNGQLLEIGRPYTLAARPSAGFVLTNWSDCAGNPITNRTTFNFRMSSNYCLRAVFEDVQRPLVAISYPLANSRVLTNNGLVTLRGAAQDNAGVAAVRYQLNGGPWALAVGTNTWTATAPMGLGTNVLAVFAEDAAGLRSLTNRIMFHHVVTSPLTLSIVGRGTVSGATNGQLLEVGRLYTLAAWPAAGFVLTNWSDCESNVLGAASRATYVIQISVDGLRPDAISALGSSALPNFHRLRRQGAFTDNARTDPDHTVTLPNHTCLLTGLGVAGPSGHNWTYNDVMTEDQTLAVNRGSYVPGVFDVVHDRGLRTGLFASKDKFSIFVRSWNATNGAPDLIGADNGRNKIDVSELNPDTTALVGSLITNMLARPFHFVFLHYANTDNKGHSDGWNVAPGTPYSDAVRQMDTHLGALFAMVDGSVQLSNRTAIILTADHGGVNYDHDDVLVEANYTIPFYVWGPAVTPGVELYVVNPSRRDNPGPARPDYSALPQPVRNGDAANLALRWLGLPSVPGSTINADQSLSAIAPLASSAVVKGATLSFRMTSNACLRAVFEDVKRPALTLLYPGNGARVLTNNGLVTLRGTALDNAGVTAVRYQLNNGLWTLATGTSNWTATALMGAGTNTLGVFAEDAAGHPSLTNRIVFQHVATSPLALEVVGAGTVSGATNGQLLEVGRTYFLTARAGTGSVFSNWTDCADVLLTNRAGLGFRMQTNTCLRARFHSVVTSAAAALADTAAETPLAFEVVDQPSVAKTGRLQLRLGGPAAATVVIEASPDLFNWTPIMTNTISVDGLSVGMPTGEPGQFFRARQITP